MDSFCSIRHFFFRLLLQLGKRLAYIYYITDPPAFQPIGKKRPHSDGRSMHYYISSYNSSLLKAGSLI